MNVINIVETLMNISYSKFKPIWIHTGESTLKKNVSLQFTKTSPEGKECSEMTPHVRALCCCCSDSLGIC